MLETGRMHYRKTVADVQRFLKTDGISSLLLWQETSAQHFDADGENRGLRTNVSRTECVAMQNNSEDAAAWGESRAKTAAQAHGV